jgi:amino acid adenylation domain-containing protein
VNEVSQPEIVQGDSVPAWFERIAAARQGDSAIRSSCHAWTYGELNRYANKVAHALLASLGGNDAPVAVLFEHDAPAIAAILGVLKAGMCYVCLEASFPEARNREILADSLARLVLCDRANLGGAKRLAQDRLGLLVFENLADAFPRENPGISVKPEMPLGIFYTSGSTGLPKGVLWHHDICLHRVLVDRLTCPVSSLDRMTLLTPLIFPAASSDMYWALLNGASLHVYDIKKFGTAYLLAWLRQEGITCMRMPVALFRHFLDSLESGIALSGLRFLVLSGDALFKLDVDRARDHLPDDCVIVHRYSMSETGLVCQLKLGREIPVEGTTVPVGRPVAGKRVRILDANQKPVTSFEEPGEIAVSSRYLAVGYWTQTELTRARFLIDPDSPRNRLYLTGDIGRFRADGCLELLGRSDYRIKIRGYRVEVAAVEAALHRLNSVKDAAVVAWPDPSGEKALVAHVVPRATPAPDAKTLRRQLSETLPDFMLPAWIVHWPSLPLTPNGKIDRKLLSNPERVPHQPATSAPGPHTVTEERVAAIWSDLLHLEQLGREDNFFDLGGHSLLGARLIARINKVFQVSLPLIILYHAPTIAELAALIERGGDASQPDSTNSSLDITEVLRMLGEF